MAVATWSVPLPHVFQADLSPHLSHTPSLPTFPSDGTVQALMSFSHEIVCGLRPFRAS